jgi:hypothetical protein
MSIHSEADLLLCARACDIMQFQALQAMPAFLASRIVQLGKAFVISCLTFANTGVLLASGMGPLLL